MLSYGCFPSLYVATAVSLLLLSARQPCSQLVSFWCFSLLPLPYECLNSGIMTYSRACCEMQAGEKSMADFLRDTPGATKQAFTTSNNLWSCHWDWTSSSGWTLESPSRRLVLEYGHEYVEMHQVLMHPGNLLASHRSPFARQDSPADSPADSPFLWSQMGGALVKASSGLAILDRKTQEPISTWNCPDSCLDFEAAIGSGLVCVEAAIGSGLVCVVASTLSNSDWRWHTGSFAVLEQYLLQEPLVIKPPIGACQGALAAGKRPAAVRCKWVQPPPDQQHAAGLWWCDAVDGSNSRLCIYSLLDSKRVAHVDCQTVLGFALLSQIGCHAARIFSSQSSRAAACRTPHTAYWGVFFDVSGFYRMLVAPHQASSHSPHYQLAVSIFASTAILPATLSLVSPPLLDLFGEDRQVKRSFPGRIPAAHDRLSGHLSSPPSFCLT